MISLFDKFSSFPFDSRTTPQNFSIQTRVNAIVTIVSFVFVVHIQDPVPIPDKIRHVTVPLPPSPEGLLFCAIIGDVGLYKVHARKEKELEAPLCIVVVPVVFALCRRSDALLFRSKK